MKKYSFLEKRNSTKSSVHKLKLEYIQSQINKIRNLVEDGQLRLSWQTVNEMKGNKSTLKTYLKAASKEERLQNWKEQFKIQLKTA